MNEQEVKRKAKAIQTALKGLEVEYLRHRPYNGGLTPDMAHVNGYSIIWHSGAYCAGEPYTVEARLPDGEIEGHVPISKLRAVVS